ncbi:MAG: 5'/3'-nucleotidase SurE [Bacteroidaceae bacterium]|jgi:5'-nucleotidase|nr:5'/3'-nucleotidase SurE [Bacteroidaceae bacterium]
MENRTTQGNRPLILISNDDGVQAQGIKELTAMMCRLGDVIVVAPDGPRSASSCSISPLTTITVRLLKQQQGLTVYQCSGTPTDCIKLALDGLLERKPDLVVSGINHGDNASVSIHYSGTVGAAYEACMKNVPAIAYSLKTKSLQCNFRPYEETVMQTARYALENGLPQDVLLNVNFPEVEELKGTKICRVGRGRWMKEMMQVGEGAYRLTGYFQNLEPDAEDTDYWALEHGFASVTPLQLDMTAYTMLGELKIES